MNEIVLHQFICLRCQHKWHPRKTTIPVTCPKCRSPYWDRPYEDSTLSGFEQQSNYAHGKGGKQ